MTTEITKTPSPTHSGYLSDIDTATAKSSRIKRYCELLEEGPTAYHATQFAVYLLQKNGFTLLREDEKWNLRPGQKCVVTRADKTFAAFVLPKETLDSFALVGGHTDSPALVPMSRPDKIEGKNHLLVTEVYGGPLLPTWVGKPLGLAGRVTYINENGEEITKVINISEAVGNVVTLPPHLDRERVTTMKINPAKDLDVFVKESSKKRSAFIEILRVALPDMKKKIKVDEISHDLYFYPLQKPTITLAGNVISYRQDNLSGTHAALEGILGNSEPESSRLKMIMSFHHEEIGSLSYEGACGNFFDSVIDRITECYKMTVEERHIMMAKSGHLSLDVAHAGAPGFSGDFQPQHTPTITGGVVLKRNTIKYEYGNAHWLRQIAKSEVLPLQDFHVKQDHPCGSTIAKILAAKGVRTVDAGVPLFAMHSTDEQLNLEVQNHVCTISEKFLSHDFTTLS
ncbi:MAG: hypothetical protein H7A37_08345 [Chlamydiales bacterium]|nr:hypothetical protein [Chlamydiia bacterium]MCP5508288.1 hypothetical protein [Chlamydiales bacterium]